LGQRPRIDCGAGSTIEHTFTEPISVREPPQRIEKHRMPITSRRCVLLQILASCAVPTVLVTTGCGTILHPERKGQPAGQIDWTIAALDGLGLLMFFVPGVIAFAVDFNNGTIYLPSRSTMSDRRCDQLLNGLVAVSIGTNRPTHSDIERVLMQEAKVTVDLRKSRVLKSRLNSIQEFWAARARFMNSLVRPGDPIAGP
jgi:hypothetical protein